MSDSTNGKVERAILFDIDGTLIRAVKRREYRTFTREMLVEVFGTSGRIAEVDFAGKTDLSIYAEALECAGITYETIIDRLAVLEKAKIGVIERMVAAGGDVFHVCPGVPELLEALSSQHRLIPSLLTGNLERLAEAKLRLVGLWNYFKVRGAFGSDHRDRDQLPAIAADRIIRHLGHALAPDRFVIVGDTPRDIACARHFGARVLAVASGTFSTEQLAAFAPDVLIEDLTNTENVLSVLNTI
ncbi:MAG TPA: HAD family hydrolase [Blastocatellia bacterium]|nr:HAD family hydrolase [Blastocatellia bacterium]